MLTSSVAQRRVRPIHCLTLIDINCLKMTKLQILNAYLTERLMVAVREILEVVGDTVSEYQEETARIHRENESLRRKLRDVVIEAETGWTGAPHLLSISLPPSLSPGGSSPVEQQDWSSGLREQLAGAEEQQEVCERRRSRQKEEDVAGPDRSCAMEAELQSECGTPGLKKLALEIALSVVSPSSLSVSHELSAMRLAEDAAPRARPRSPAHLRSAQVKTEPDEGPEFKSEQPPELSPAAKAKSHALEPLLEASVGEDSEALGAGVGHMEGTGPQEAGTRMNEIQNESYFVGYRGEKQHRCFQCGKFFSQSIPVSAVQGTVHETSSSLASPSQVAAGKLACMMLSARLSLICQEQAGQQSCRHL
ncbi:hypothetical protein COCON_G00201600 [Conger conger]|uniref:Uncharacterized protein n=1 Tax=Conger conger TaxID=82655 RepID=A0A9Q1CZB1_CONCO|nr:hypothetical protein COCON_G00201600 [Conger conger]